MEIGRRSVNLEMMLLVLIAGFIMFFHLGAMPLLDPDEPVYAQTPVEMLAAHDLISPRIYGEFWYDKPPMYYWLVAAAFKLFGQSEFAARFPSALLAVAGVALVYVNGKALLNRRAALFGALALATSAEYFYLGKAAVTDSTLTFFMTACLLFYLRRWYYPAYIAAGLAVLTKGPVGLVLPGMIVLVHLFLTRNLAGLKRVKLPSGLLLTAAVFGPWYGAMTVLHGRDFLNGFLGFNNITRFLRPEHADSNVWYYYAPVLIVGFFPWTAYLAQALRAAWRNRAGGKGDVVLFLTVWAAAVFLFFSVSQTKLVSYILPLYPPLALLVGWYIDRCLALKAVEGFKRATVVLAVLSVMITAALMVAAQRISPGMAAGAALLGLVLTAMVLGAGLSVYAERCQTAVGSMVVGMMFFVVVLMNNIFPALTPFFSVKSIAADFTRSDRGGTATVFVEKYYRPGFAYYTGAPGREMAGDWENYIAGGQENVYFVMKDKRYLNLPQTMKSRLQIVAQHGNVVLLRKNIKPGRSDAAGRG